MADKLKIGQYAPDFDLTSTEDALLMLRDEVPRMFVVLYFFGDPAQERLRADLEVLAKRRDELLAQHTVILGISGTKMPALKQTQKDLHLLFPLLNDDRNFAASYGIEPVEDAELDPGLFLVGRDQEILWEANPVSSVDAGLQEILATVGRQPSLVPNMPSAVVNRVVDWWVNRVRGSRVT